MSCTSPLGITCFHLLFFFSRRFITAWQNWTSVVTPLGAIYSMLSINKQLILKLIVHVDGCAVLISWSDLGSSGCHQKELSVSLQTRGNINQVRQMSLKLHNASNYEHIVWVCRDYCYVQWSGCHLALFASQRIWKIALIKNFCVHISVPEK